jgi:hypothetical protein
VLLAVDAVPLDHFRLAEGAARQRRRDLAGSSGLGEIAGAHEDIRRLERTLDDVGDARSVGRDRRLVPVSAVALVLFEDRRHGARFQIDPRETDSLAARIRAQDHGGLSCVGREQAVLPGGEDLQLVSGGIREGRGG